MGLGDPIWRDGGNEVAGLEDSRRNPEPLRKRWLALLQCASRESTSGLNQEQSARGSAVTLDSGLNSERDSSASEICAMTPKCLEGRIIPAVLSPANKDCVGVVAQWALWRFITCVSFHSTFPVCTEEQFMSRRFWPP